MKEEKNKTKGLNGSLNKKKSNSDISTKGRQKQHVCPKTIAYD